MCYNANNQYWYQKVSTREVSCGLSKLGSIKVSYCEHAGEEVALEAEIVYPPTYLPDQAPASSPTAAHAGWRAIVLDNPVVVGQEPTRAMILLKRKKSANPHK